jgi:hypothetical protein
MVSVDRFDDVSVVASVDETPEPPRMPRRTRRAYMGFVATVVAVGALAGATVGLASEKKEPSRSAAAAAESQTLPTFSRSGHPCHHGDGVRPSRSAQLKRY